MPHSEVTEVVLIHCNIVKNDYQQNALNRSFVQLLDISAKHFIFSETFNLEFSYTEVWFADQR